MFEKLEQLRKLPEHKKQIIALSTAVGITGIIFIFWAVSLSVTLGSPNQDSSISGGTASASVSPFAALEANIGAAFAPVGSTFQGIAAYFSGSSTTPADMATTTIHTTTPIVGTPQPVAIAVPQQVVITTPISVSTQQPTFIDHLLMPGDVGPQVVILQKVLATQGFYNGPINGKLGPATDAALVRFQAAHGIIPIGKPGSGQVGPKTRDLINHLAQGSSY